MRFVDCETESDHGRSSSRQRQQVRTVRRLVVMMCDGRSLGVGLQPNDEEFRRPSERTRQKGGHVGNLFLGQAVA